MAEASGRGLCVDRRKNWTVEKFLTLIPVDAGLIHGGTQTFWLFPFFSENTHFKEFLSHCVETLLLWAKTDWLAYKHPETIFFLSETRPKSPSQQGMLSPNSLARASLLPLAPKIMTTSTLDKGLIWFCKEGPKKN